MTRKDNSQQGSLGPIDFSELGMQLLPHVKRVIGSLDSGARLKGDELWFADPHKTGGDRDRDTASINVQSGAWHARASGKGGHDLVSAVAYITAQSQTEAAQTALDLAGLSSIPRLSASAHASASCADEIPDLAYSGAILNEEARRNKIRQILKDNPAPVSGTIAENYFTARRIVPFPSVDEARFASALPYWDGDRCYGHYPAVLFRMTNAATGDVSNVMRVYLRSDGGAKLELKSDDGAKLSPKKVVGPYDGCAMWFLGRSGEIGEEVILCEGPEDALSIRLATGQTVVAAGSWHQLEKVALPPHVKRVVIVPDDNSDPDDPAKTNVGEEGLERAARVFSAAGIEVYVARIPNRMDANDILCSKEVGGGLEGLRGIIEARVPYKAPHVDGTRESTFKRRRVSNAVFDDEVEITFNKRYLVKHLVEPGTLCALYGPSTVGKTFLAIDLAAHIAQGKPWASRPTEKSPVLYVGLEGVVGLDRRIKAITESMGMSDGRLARFDGYVTLGDDELGTLGEKTLIATCEEIRTSTGEPVGLIVIDTLWRAMAGGEENSAKEMGAVVARLNRVIQKTGAAILVVHHPGKDLEKGMRGSNSLFAACDCVLKAYERDGSRRVEIEKSKDDLQGPCFTYNLQPVALGRDDDGEEVTSCVVEKQLPGKHEEFKRERPPEATPQGKALNELEHLIIDRKGQVLNNHERIPDGAEVVKLEDWAEACRKKGLANSTTDNADNRRRAEDQAFRRACQKLEKSSLVCMYDGLVWIPRTRVQTRLKDPARKPGKVAGANEE